MGRQEKPFDPDAGPVERFAHDLRQLREQAGKPTYRAMAGKGNASASALSAAASGSRLPSLMVTLAYVRACDGDLQEWQARWHATHQQLNHADDTDTAHQFPPTASTTDSPPGDAEAHNDADGAVPPPVTPMTTPTVLAASPPAAVSAASAAIPQGRPSHRPSRRRMAVYLASVVVFTALAGSAAALVAPGVHDSAAPAHHAARRVTLPTPHLLPASPTPALPPPIAVPPPQTTLTHGPHDGVAPTQPSPATLAPGQQTPGPPPNNPAPPGGTGTDPRSDSAPTYNCGSGANGWGCQGKDPFDSGCDHMTAYRVSQQADAVRNGQVIGHVYMYYSKTCGTNWAVTAFVSGYQGRAEITNGGYTNCYPDDCTSLGSWSTCGITPGMTCAWTNMAYGANTSVTGSGRIQSSDNSWGQDLSVTPPVY